ncbi:killer cell lectin-like receptor subfamily F member 1 [Elgaria multicarinata webbii]|uniref:killer cell lectin-like receptor subfamily F member 1 n=1 Tax=Elgaria multicarinata webbii TaxID=159646 RepID=UPI002FCCD97B
MEYAKDCKLCPNDWIVHQGNCYWISQDKRNWTQSQDDCRAKNSTLLVIQNQEEMAFISKEIQKTHYWLGLIAMYSERWTWVDGSPLTKELFSVTGPAQENSCGLKKKDVVISDSCSSLARWVCMKAAFQI